MNVETAVSAVNNWLQTIAADTPITMDDDLQCAVKSETGTDVLLQVIDDNRLLNLYAPVMELGGVPDPHMLQKALELNLYQLSLNGFVMAYDPVAQALVLNKNIEIDGGRDVDLGAILTIFAGTAEAARATFGEMGSGPAQHPSGTEDGSYLLKI